MKKPKQFKVNSHITTLNNKKVINFGKIINQEMKDLEFKKEVELEMQKLKLSIEINKLRKKENISQLKLAEKIGMKQSAIGRIEQGKQNLTFETLHKIAQALNKKLEVKFK